MEKSRMFKNGVIVALVVAVLCLSVAFAAFAQTLTINGTVNVASATDNWNVKITSVSTDSVTGYATGSVTPATIEAQEGVVEVSFTCDAFAPGDSCTLNGTITNLGTIKAQYQGAKLTVNETEEATLKHTEAELVVEVTEPTGWTAETTVLNAEDAGNFTVKVTVPDTALMETEATHTFKVTFDFTQAANA